MLKLEPGSNKKLRELITEVVTLSKEEEEMSNHLRKITSRLEAIDKEVIKLTTGKRFAIELGDERYFVEFEEGSIALTDLSTLTIDDYS